MIVNVYRRSRNVCWWWTVFEVGFWRTDNHTWFLQRSRCREISTKISRLWFTLRTARDDDEYWNLSTDLNSYIFDLGALHTARLGARVYSRDEVYFISTDTQNIWSTCRRLHRFKDTRATCSLYLRGMPSWRWNFKHNLFYFQTNTLEKEIFL